MKKVGRYSGTVGVQKARMMGESHKGSDEAREKDMGGDSGRLVAEEGEIYIDVK